MEDLKLGTNHLFTVIREESDQYIIKQQNVTIALLKSKTTKSLRVGEMVDVFLYINHRKQLAATMETPKIDLYRADLVNVVEVKFGLGVFVDVGLDKDMLVSRDDLPVLKKQWPQINDKLFCYLKTSSNQIVAKPVSRFKMLDYFTPESALEKGDKVEAYVFSIADEGVVLFTKAGHEIFVYFKHIREALRLGACVEVTITVVKDEYRYNGSLIEQKELVIDDDASRIMTYLEAHDGVMPFGDKTAPDVIFESFHMSKAAFKRALGTLYKQGLVELSKTETVLKKKIESD